MSAVESLLSGIPKVVAFEVAFIWKLKSLFRPSEGYLEPVWISPMKLLAINYFAKKLRRRYSTGFEIQVHVVLFWISFLKFVSLFLNSVE